MKGKQLEKLNGIKREEKKVRIGGCIHDNTQVNSISMQLSSREPWRSMEAMLTRRAVFLATDSKNAETSFNKRSEISFQQRKLC